MRRLTRDLMRQQHGALMKPLPVAETLRSRVSHKKETIIRFLSHRCRVAKTTMIQTKIPFNLTDAKEYFREHLDRKSVV